MISFEITDDSKVIQIYCDQLGLKELIGELKKLLGTSGHIHLRSSLAGGGELSDQTPWKGKAISEVIVTTGGD